jgi:glycosyltransferase involved in cell wall biosynthesis
LAIKTVKYRILHIICSLRRGGNGKQLGLLTRLLPPAEFDLHVCALRNEGPLGEELVAAGTPVTDIGWRGPLDPMACWRLWRHVGGLRPDLIHTWTPAAGACGVAAARACGVRRTVATRRRIDRQQGAAQWAMDRYVARHCDALVSATAAVRDFYVARGVPSEKVRVVQSGVCPAGPPRTNRRQLLAQLGIPDGSRVVGLIGALERRKRVKDAIWAADLLKVIRDDVHLLIFGDGPERQRLERFRDNVLIRDKVHFLGNRGDLPCWLPHFDVLWSTGDREGHSNAILEAMAAGVPVVATDIPGTRDLITHDTTGYLVRVGHRAGFTRFTNQLLDDAALARRLGEAGRQRALEQFPAAAMVGRYAELYRELLG